MSAAEKIYQEEAPAAGDPVPVSYADRWTWLKEMRRQPKEVLSYATKLVLEEIFHAMNKNTGVAIIHYKTISQNLGGSISEDGAMKCAHKGATTGFMIISRGGGGIVWDEAGKAHGLACHFNIALPRTAEQGIGPTTPDGGSRYPGRPVEIPRTADRDTPDGRPDNPLQSSPSISPSRSPARATGYGTPFNGGAVAKSDSLSGEKMEDVSPSSPEPETDGAVETKTEANIEPNNPSSPDTARATLPVADMRMRAAWGDRWPNERKLVESAPNMDIAPSRLICNAMRLLGFSNAEIVDAEAPPGSGYREYSDFLEGTIDREHRKELARQMIDGRLKMVTLANVLAYYGFTPKE